MWSIPQNSVNWANSAFVRILLQDYASTSTEPTVKAKAKPGKAKVNVRAPPATDAPPSKKPKK